MDEDEATINKLISGRSPQQLYAIGATSIAILLGAFALGGFVQKLSADRTLLDKEKLIAKNEDEIRRIRSSNEEEVSKTNGIISDLKAELENTRNALKIESELVLTLDSKARFLGQYVTYLRDEGEQSKKLLVDLVCAMWREDQKRRISIQRTPLNITTETITSRR